MRLTGRKRLLELLGLLRVLEDKSVEVAVAADLELGLAGDGALLDACSYCRKTVSTLIGFCRLFPFSFLSRVFEETYRRRPCGGRSQ